MNNSGCNVEIYEDLVKKSNGGMYTATRLMSQINKQNKFKSRNWDGVSIKTPRILSQTYSVEMEKIEGVTGEELLVKLDYEGLNTLIGRLIRFIAENIWDELKFCRTSCLRSKLTEIKSKVRIESHIDWSQFHTFIDSWPELVPIPAGYYHGDLTLSNIIVKNDEIYLIDFLDSLPTSPIWDICKIRQDLVYGWTSFRRGLNHIRITENLTSALTEFIDRLQFKQSIPIFDFMVLARILPYANPAETEFLLEKMREICSKATLQN